MRGLWGVVLVLTLSGCSGSFLQARLARGGEVLCKHCNCLMPADLEPGTMCPVCNCQHTARQCVRGR